MAMPSLGSAALLGTLAFGSFVSAPGAAGTSGVPLRNGEAIVLAFAQTDTTIVPGASPSSSASSGTVVATVRANVAYDGAKGLYAISWRDAAAFGTRTAYVGFAADPHVTGTLDEMAHAYLSQSDPFVGSIVQQYVVPAITRRSPVVPGASWSAFEPEYFQADKGDPDFGVDYRLTRHSDASTRSLRTQHTLGSYTADAQEVERDGSGTRNVTSPGLTQPLHQRYGVPVAEGGRNVIDVTSTGGNAWNATPPPRTTNDVPDWFPGGGAPPQPLAADAFTVGNTVLAPSACGRVAGTPAIDVRESEYALDPVAGTYLSIQADAYDAAPVGEICNVYRVSLQHFDNVRSGAVTQERRIAGSVWLARPSQTQNGGAGVADTAAIVARFAVLDLMRDDDTY